MKPEQIREILNTADSEVVKDVAAILLAQGQSSATSVKNKIVDSTDFKNFSQAISYLKKNYKFPELNEFTTESDLVYVKAGDRKILLTKMPDEKKQSSSKRFSNLDYSDEDSYFENAWEPLRKERKINDNASSVEDETNPFADTSVLSSGSADDKSQQTEKTKKADTPSNNKSEEGTGGSRFKNLEL